MELASETIAATTGAPIETPLPPLRIAYEHADAAALLAQPDVLAVIGFGSTTPSLDTPGYVHVGLQPAAPPAPLEVWRGRSHVRRWREGEIDVCSDGDYSFAMLEVDEAAHGGIAAATRHAYAQLHAWCRARAARHVLRIWNYLDAINDGDGDDERYRQFCAGRAAGMDGVFADGYPAATAIGRRDGRRVLQLYWLAARLPGTPVENPRQLSAWHYPRRYGPAAPNFARAMRAPAQVPQVYISGTAAIVGHESRHAHAGIAQLDETLSNLDSLLAHAAAARLGPHCVLKAYVRDARETASIAARLRQRIGAQTPLLVLHGDICRAELLVEIDGVYEA